MNNSTHVTLVIDRSTSMSQVRDESQLAINNFLADQKAVDGACSLSIYEFGTYVQKVYTGDLQGFEGYALQPSGWTALLDAIGLAINETGTFLRNKPIEDRPEHVVFVVMTDGQENRSRQFTLSQIAQMKKHQEEKYNWRFVFLGAGLDAASQAVPLGFVPRDTIVMDSNTGYAHAASYAGLSKSLTATRSGVASVNYGAHYSSDGSIVENAGATK